MLLSHTGPHTQLAKAGHRECFLNHRTPSHTGPKKGASFADRTPYYREKTVVKPARGPVLKLLLTLTTSTTSCASLPPAQVAFIFGASRIFSSVDGVPQEDDTADKTVKTEKSIDQEGGRRETGTAKKRITEESTRCQYFRRARKPHFFAQSYSLLFDELLVCRLFGPEHAACADR